MPERNAADAALFALDGRMADLLIEESLRRLALDPVPIGLGAAVAPPDGALDGLLCEEGNDVEYVLDVFARTLAPSVLAGDSPSYLAFIPHAPTPAARLFDMLVSAASFPATHWFESAGVVLAENQALRVLADAAGFPGGAGGCFVSGGSSGNLSALYVAREQAAPRSRGRPRVAVSAEAHASVDLALRILAVDPLLVPTEDHRLTGSALRAALLADPDPHSVVAVVATAGTTNAGLVDDLAGIADVADAARLWFHVDGAYGGAALLVPELRDRFRGIERADSLVIDPHKWLFAPYDCGALVYREPERARALLTQKGSYLDVLSTDSDREWNPVDYAFHLTRRSRGLPFWFSLAVHGLGAYRAAVGSGVEKARAAADLVAELPYLELVRPPELSVVLFRRAGWDAADYQAWSGRLLRDQLGLVAPTAWEGAPAARLAFVHPETPLGLVRDILASMA